MLPNILASTTTTGDAQNSVTTLLWLFVAVAIVAVLTKFIKLPYTIALVIAGVGIALTPGVTQVCLLLTSS